jgi:hypothetical protein
MMSLLDTPTLVTLLVLVSGSGAFLRMVAKEKRRRERHLQFRLEEQNRKSKEQSLLRADLEADRRTR